MRLVPCSMSQAILAADSRLYDALPIALVAQGGGMSGSSRLSLGAALSDDAAARHRSVHESTIWPSPPAGVEAP